MAHSCPSRTGRSKSGQSLFLSPVHRAHEKLAGTFCGASVRYRAPNNGGADTTRQLGLNLLLARVETPAGPKRIMALKYSASQPLRRRESAGAPRGCYRNVSLRLRRRLPPSSPRNSQNQLAIIMGTEISSNGIPLPGATLRGTLSLLRDIGFQCAAKLPIHEHGCPPYLNTRHQARRIIRAFWTARELMSCWVSLFSKRWTAGCGSESDWKIILNKNYAWDHSFSVLQLVGCWGIS